MMAHIGCIIGAVIGGFAAGICAFYIGVRQGAKQVLRIQQIRQSVEKTYEAMR